MATTPDINFAFSTPICKFDISNFDDKQKDLVKYLKSLKRKSEGIQSSNFDGWHSARNLHQDMNEHVQWLVRRVNISIIKALQKLNNTTEGVDISLREMWVNINQQGSWNMPHIHAVKWSGVIYIDGESSNKDKNDKKLIGEGDTVFLNPVPEAAYFGQPNSVPYQFSPGQMLFFPGYLMHMVSPRCFTTEMFHPHGGFDMSYIQLNIPATFIKLFEVILRRIVCAAHCGNEDLISDLQFTNRQPFW